MSPLRTSLPLLLALLALTGSAAAQNGANGSATLGRLFFTPEKRATLERQRQLNIQETQTLEGASMSLDGVIVRSSGRELDIADTDLNTMSLEEIKKFLDELKNDFKAITTAGMQGKDIVSGILSMGSGSPVDFKQEDIKAIIQRSVQTVKLG